MKYFGFVIILACIMVACSNQESEKSTQTENQQDETIQHTTAVSLRNVDVKVENGNAVINGEVQASNTNVYYILEYNNQTTIEEQEVELENMDEKWQDFSIKMKLPEDSTSRDEPPIITFYGKNDQGDKVNANYIPVDM
ncbi:hypothetical protein [Virgibacillus salexigens]|uniref:hypothetical protein n=1 Tax=Virgibacillus TaxID=84406 RepID=UPI00136BA252|nr:hypothetical protein [Virgibacillus massiliensis]MYL42771.1 hypothetical protein [Virgibacillus massiliensis]